jgi:hypothetical protein
VRNQMEKIIKIHHMDNGGEFVNKDFFLKLWRKWNYEAIYNALNTWKQNGIVKRKNRILVKSVWPRCWTMQFFYMV